MGISYLPEPFAGNGCFVFGRVPRVLDKAMQSDNFPSHGTQVGHPKVGPMVLHEHDQSQKICIDVHGPVRVVLDAGGYSIETSTSGMLADVITLYR